MGDEACRSRLSGEEGRAEPTPKTHGPKGTDFGLIFGVDNEPLFVKIMRMDTDLAYMGLTFRGIHRF
jgi:hypothetical protein